MTKFISIFSVLLMLIAVSVYAARDEATARAIWNFDEGDAADTLRQQCQWTASRKP